MQTLPVSASVAPRSAPRLRRGFRDGAALALAPLSRAAPVPSAAAALFAAPARVAHRRRAAPLAPPRGSLVLGATTRALAPRRAPASSLRSPAPRSRPSSLRVVSDASSGRGLSEFPVADRRAELSKMTMAKLKPLCKGCGLKMGGKKGELIDRLLEHEFGTADDEADVDPRDDIVGLANEWRAGRSVVGGAPGGATFGDLDAVESMFASASFGADERAADAVLGASALGFDDGGYAVSSEARGDMGPGADANFAARVVGKSLGDAVGFDDGAGAGWRDDAGGWDRDEDPRDGYDYDASSPPPPPAPPPPPTKEELAALRKAKAKKERLSLEKRSAVVAALRQLATEREGFAADPRLHLEAVSRAIEDAYRAMRYSAYAKMDPRAREVCVDINVSAGTLVVSAQKIGRSGAVEWEVDDTDAFLAAHSKRHQMRKLASALVQELNDVVSTAAARSYAGRKGEMIEATVVTRGRRGEYLLESDDGAYLCLPEEEQIPERRYAQGDRVCCLCLGLDEQTWAGDRKAPVLVSTAIAGLIAEVLKAEVPEVARGDVVVKSVARVSGKMSKVAVASGDAAEGSSSSMDPVLAVVGVENARLRAIRERLGGEVCQVLQWTEDREAMVAEALFPAHVLRVEAVDETGDERRLEKFVAYVNRFDEAKAIGAGGSNVKLAAALCGCFIEVQRANEESGGGGGYGASEGRFGFEEPRGFDRRRDDNGGGGGGWGDDDDAFGFDDRVGSLDRRGEGIDIAGDGLDDLGWPDLEKAPAEAEAEAEAHEARLDPRLDDANWEEVGPGKVGCVTFGGNLGAGIAGGCSFMGDPEVAEADALFDAAEARGGGFAGLDDDDDDAFEGRRPAFGDDDDDDAFYSGGAGFGDDDGGGLFAEDDLFGEDWNA